MQFRAVAIPLNRPPEHKPGNVQRPEPVRFELPADGINASTQLFAPTGLYPNGVLVVSWVELTDEEHRDLQYQQALQQGGGKLIT